MPAPPPPEPTAAERLPTLRADRPVVLRDVALRISCRARRHAGRCVLEVTALARADAPAVLELVGVAPGDAMQLDGGGEGIGVTLEAGRPARLRIRLRRRLRESRSSGAYFVVEPMLARHPYLGEFESVRRRAGTVGGALFDAESVQLAGGLRWRFRLHRRMSVRFEDEVARRSGDGERASAPTYLIVELEAPRPTPPGLRRGGPILAMGVNFDAERVVLAGGYEVGIGAFAFVSARLETDARRRLGAVLYAEAALPGVLLLPSLSLGTGLRVDLYDDVAAAWRVGMGTSFPVLGVHATLDWFPRQRRVAPQLTVRVGF